MFCPHCRMEIPDGLIYCPECNEQLPVVKQRRSLDRDAIIRWWIGFGIILALGGIAASVIVPMIVPSGTVGQPEPVKQVVIATAAPVRTAAPAMTAIPAATSVPTPLPAAAPVFAGPAQPDTRIYSTDDAAALFAWMVETNTPEVKLDELAISDDQVRDAAARFPEIDRYQWNRQLFRVELRMGAQIIAACKNGGEQSLSAEAKGILQEARNIVSSLIRPGMSDLEKEIQLHDYIIYNCEYEISKSLKTDDARGFFNHGRVQCSGYSDVFRLLGYLCGLDIRSVAGDVAGETGGHEWNLIRLDGLWYAVDVTWDDPKGGGAETGIYLNFPHHMLDSTRIYDRAQLPEGAYAQQLDRNHPYARQGLIVSSAAEAEQLLRSQLVSGSTLEVCSVSGSMDVSGMVKKICMELNRAASWSTSNVNGPGSMVYYRVTFN